MQRLLESSVQKRAVDSMEWRRRCQRRITVSSDSGSEVNSCQLSDYKAVVNQAKISSYQAQTEGYYQQQSECPAVIEGEGEWASDVIRS